MPSEAIVRRLMSDSYMHGRYYPYIAGPVLPPTATLLQITNDPHDAGAALVGDSLLSDSKLALEALSTLVKSTSTSSSDGAQESALKKALNDSDSKSSELETTAMDVFTAIAQSRPKDAILVNESPSNTGDLLHAWPALLCYQPA